MNLASDILEGSHRVLSKWRRKSSSRAAAGSRRQRDLVDEEADRARRSSAPSPEPPRLRIDAQTIDASGGSSDPLNKTEIRDRERELEPEGQQPQRQEEEEEDTKMEVEDTQHEQQHEEAQSWSGSTSEVGKWRPESHRPEAVATTPEKGDDGEKARLVKQQQQKPQPRLVLFCPHCKRNSSSHQGNCQRAKQQQHSFHQQQQQEQQQNSMHLHR